MDTGPVTVTEPHRTQPPGRAPRRSSGNRLRWYHVSRFLPCGGTCLCAAGICIVLAFATTAHAARAAAQADGANGQECAPALTLQAACEQPIATAWSACLAAGWLRSDKPNPQSASPNIGTELHAEARRQMASLLALEVGGSPSFTGDYFKTHAGGDPPTTLFEL